MKTSSTICLSLILSISFASNANAAKENFDRSKPYVRATNGLDNDCNDKKANPLAKRPQGAAGQQPTCTMTQAGIKGGGHVTVLKANQGNDPQNMRNLYVSSRSNKNSNKSSVMPGGGHVTVLKARLRNDPQTNGTRAQDHNSSSSNRGVKYQDGDDLVLRKRPGRTKYTPPGNCPTPQKGVKSQAKSNCPAKNQ